uniref:Uncharacterized protein n=1 Tax=Malurus cyaneus samueli TaxID=2593467 RepID=A0A8C5X092_9PASS
MPVSFPAPRAKAQGQSIVHPWSGVRVIFLDFCTTQSPWNNNNPFVVLATGRTHCKALPLNKKEKVFTPGLEESTGESAEHTLPWDQPRGTVLELLKGSVSAAALGVGLSCCHRARPLHHLSMHLQACTSCSPPPCCRLLFRFHSWAVKTEACSSAACKKALPATCTLASSYFLLWQPPWSFSAQ